MTSNLQKHRALKFALILVISAPCVSIAQTAGEPNPEQFGNDPWVAEVPCRGTEKEQHGFIANREFRLCFSFTENLLQPTPAGTANSSDLHITIYTKKEAQSIMRIGLVRGSPEEHPGLIVETPILCGRETGRFSSSTEFKVPIQVNNDARSGRYPIFVTLISGIQKGEYPVEFKLPILATARSSVSVEKKRNTVVDCWAGKQCSPLELEVKNSVPYKLTISNISISSEDLLEGQAHRRLFP
jgi:hypothetical protein